MKSFAQKKAELAELKDKLVKAKLVIFTSFARAGEKGLNVAEMRNLKKALRAVNGEYVVGKKTLIDKALKTNNGQGTADGRPDIFGYEGSSGIAFGFGDEAATAKVLHTFAKKLPKLRVFGAFLRQGFGGRALKLLDDKTVLELAKLPNREMMLARTIGMIKYPLSGLVNVLNANIRNLVGVLNQVSNKK